MDILIKELDNEQPRSAKASLLGFLPSSLSIICLERIEYVVGFVSCIQG